MRKTILLFLILSLPAQARRYGTQNQPDPHRALQIQAALVRAGYLAHTTGRWDQATKDALRRLQKDHGWQHIRVPDSRAIIFLGLGPDYSHALKFPDPIDQLPNQ